MTIDEMIKALSSEPEFGDVWVEKEACAAIIGAIKAGHTLYEACAIDDMDEESTQRINGAMASWDAVTMKGDE